MTLLVLSLFFGSLNHVLAQTAASAPITSLPPEVEGYFEYQVALAHLNSTQITQMRALWIQRLEYNREFINKYFGGISSVAISQKTMSQNINYSDPDYFFSFYKTEAFTGQGGSAWVANGLNVFKNNPDWNSFSELYANKAGSGASICGEMSGETSPYGVDAPYLNVYAKDAQANATYLMLEGDNSNINDDESLWMQGFLGSIQVSGSSERDYLQPDNVTFKYLNIGVLCMGK